MFVCERGLRSVGYAFGILGSLQTSNLNLSVCVFGTVGLLCFLYKPHHAPLLLLYTASLFSSSSSFRFSSFPRFPIPTARNFQFSGTFRLLSFWVLHKFPFLENSKDLNFWVLKKFQSFCFDSALGSDFFEGVGGGDISVISRSLNFSENGSIAQMVHFVEDLFDSGEKI